MPHPFLHRCLHLARIAGTDTLPNPRVGAVIVYEGEIIGEGFHPYAGGPHAEVQAVNAVQDKSLLKKSTIYVSLEPCSYHGRTPPCTDLILRHQIPHVVVGCKDPNPKVAGNGISRLREHGVIVETAADPGPFESLIQVFTVNQLQLRPFITLKWAESADGFIAARDKQGQPERVRISSLKSDLLVHKLRSEHQAILVGRKTAKIDNPQLNTRLFYGNDPLRIVMDRNLQLPKDLNLFRDGRKTLVLNDKKSGEEGNIRFFQPSQWQNVEVLMEEIYENCGVCSILLEGGTDTLQPFIHQGIYDQIIRIQAKRCIDKGVHAPDITPIAHWDRIIHSGEDLVYLVAGSNKHR